MKVTSWISYEEAQSYPDNKIGGMGGWFNFHEKGQRWKDYIGIFEPQAHIHIEALRESIIENNIRTGGDDHQQSDNGVPLFSDGTVATYSYRAWGDLMAAVWSEVEDKDYNYMDFYMT